MQNRIEELEAQLAKVTAERDYDRRQSDHKSNVIDRLNRTGQECIDAWKARAETAEAKLTEAEANINIKADWIDATLNDMAGEHEVIETYRAVIPVAYQMGLEAGADDADVYADIAEESDFAQGGEGWHVNRAADRIRALTPPADLVEQAIAKAKETK